MSIPLCSSAGGTLNLTIGGVVYSVRGKADINPAKFKVEAMSNLDGTLATTLTPTPVTASFTLSDRIGLSIKELMGNQCSMATLELDTVGKTYILVNAAVVGEPSLDVTTGEISGLELAAADTREIVETQASVTF